MGQEEQRGDQSAQPEAAVAQLPPLRSEQQSGAKAGDEKTHRILVEQTQSCSHSKPDPQIGTLLHSYFDHDPGEQRPEKEIEGVHGEIARGVAEDDRGESGRGGGQELCEFFPTQQARHRTGQNHHAGAGQGGHETDGVKGIPEQPARRRQDQYA